MLGGETVRVQKLDNVCTTRHLYDLDADGHKTLKANLEDILLSYPSLIMIVSEHQHGIRRVLADLSKKKTGIRARNCGKVTSTGTLWKISRFN